jgi:hypothetical protein
LSLVEKEFDMAAKGLTKDIPRASGKPKKKDISIAEVVKRTGHARETLLKLCNKGVLKAQRFGGWPGKICIDKDSLDEAIKMGKVKPLAQVARKHIHKVRVKVKKKAVKKLDKTNEGWGAHQIKKKTKKKAKKQAKKSARLKGKLDIPFRGAAQQRPRFSFNAASTESLLRDYRRATASCLILKKGWAPEAVESFLQEVDEFEAMLFNIE